VLLTFGCSFDPTLSGPLSGMDAGEDAVAVSDADDPADEGGTGDAAIPDSTSDASGDQGIDTRRSADMRSTDAADTGSEDAGPTMCDGMSVDLLTHPDHCGECDNACDPVHGSCVAGDCGCELGGTACGADNLCTNTDFDPNNCGQCGRVCGVGEVCIDGDCFCREGLRDCNGECVDVDNDPQHCGECDEDCGGDVCIDRECRPRNNCPIGTWNCDTGNGKACIRGGESDLHCGPSLTDACGTTCQGDEFCFDPGLFDGPRCVRYRPGLGCTDCPCDDCTNEESCVTTENVPGVAYCVSE
jgi:hypothetical protein